MTVDQASLGSFADLATAIGLLGADGDPNPAWFENPANGGSAESGHGLQHLLADSGQREALIRFVDSVLGPPEARTTAGARWVPLFSNDDPTLAIYAVVEHVAVASEVRLGIGVEHTTQGGPPSAATRLHAPLFRFAERGSTLGPDDTLPAWLLLGRAGGEIELELDTTILAGAPPAGEASLGGVAARVSIPTRTDGAVAFGLTLRDLQLPGAAAPRSFTLDAGSAEGLGADVLDLVAGLVRAQAEALADVPAFRPFAALAGMLGLGEVTGLDPLPLADLPTRGVQAVVEWLEAQLEEPTKRAAWLGELATLVDGDLDADRNAVLLDLGALQLALGLRVGSGTGGHPVLVPWVEVAMRTSAGAPVVAMATIDLLRADTGTGDCVAVPDLRLEATFGTADDRLLGSSAAADPKVDSLHVGVRLDSLRRPAFLLTAHGVRLNGVERDVADLSSPDAAIATGAALLDTALLNALDALGPAAPLVKRVIGIEHPASVEGVGAADLLSDPLGAVQAYWAELVGKPAAAADVLGRLAALLSGEAAAALPQAGTQADPWRIELADPLALQVWSDGSALRVDVAFSLESPVFGSFISTNDLRFTCAVLDPGAGTVTFAQGARFTSALAMTDGSPARLGGNELALVFDRLAVELVWLPAVGLRPQLAADGLALETPARIPGANATGSVPIPLPQLDQNGTLRFDAPDWDRVEAAIALLVGRLATPELDALVRLLGWDGSGARLSLAGLLGADPAAAVEAWFADLLLDCDLVRAALGPVASLLSGFSLSAPLGTGNADDPFRAPVAGERRAPGLRVWLGPGCAVPADATAVNVVPLLGTDPPEPELVAETLRAAGQQAPELAALMVGRDSLGQGLQALLDRWAGTDGLVGRPDAMPDGVTSHELEGLSYDGLVALGGVGALLGQVVETAPAAVLHVGCEQSWLQERPPGTAFDLTATAPSARVPDDVNGTWFARLASPAAAGAARPDLGAVGAQAALLGALLADRTRDIVLVGYGPAGAAVVRAAATGLPVTRVITVGTPWGEVFADSLRSGLGGDALRLLRLLHRSDAEDWPEELTAHEMSPLQQMRRIVVRSVDSLTPGALPDASTETRPAGVAIDAVFGSLDAADLAGSLAAHVADGILARTSARVSSAPAEPMTSVHAAVDVPVLDLNLGGLLVGVGAAFELATVSRPAAGDGVEASLARGVIVDVHLGVHDGWLIGGPGSSGGAGDLRWMSARVQVPLDGSPGDVELVLHEARGLGIERERWVVRPNLADPAPTAAVPEVRTLLSAVLDRVSAASAPLATLLQTFGLRRAGGLDAATLDRLLNDPAATLRPLVAADAAAVAGALRALVPASTGSGAAVGWTLGPATVSLDLATGAVTGEVALDVEGLLPVELAVSSSPGATRGALAVGALDAHLGGARLVAATPAGPGLPATVAVEVAGAGSPVRTVGLWPEPDSGRLSAVAADLVPALGLKLLAETALSTATTAGRPLVEQALDALGLLATVGSRRRVVLPVAVVADPVGWLTGLARAGSGNPAAAAVTVLDALAALLVPTRGSEPGWPIADGVVVGYEQLGEQLRLTLEVQLAVPLDTDTTVTTRLEVGALLGPGSPPTPIVSAALDIEGRGLALDLDPTLRISLVRPAPAAPLPLFPEGPGLGSALGAAAESLMPLLLDELADLATGPAGFEREVGELVAELGDALALRENGHFTARRVSGFAANPAAALSTHLPALVGQAAATLAELLDPSGAAVAVTQQPGQVLFCFGADQSVTLALMTSPSPAVEVTAEWQIPDVGTVALESLRVSSAGVAIAARLGPVPVAAGPLTLRPLVVVRAGTAVTSERLVSIGLALDDAALRSVEARWGLDGQPPRLLGVTRSASGAQLSARQADGPPWLLSIALGLVAGVVVDALDPLLDDRAEQLLEGVLFSTGTTIDPALAADLLDAPQLLQRLQRLLWNAATTDASDALSVTIDGIATISLAREGDDSNALLGVNLSLSEEYVLADTGTRVVLDVDESWLQPEVQGGLSIYVVRGTHLAGTYSFTLEPAVTVAGLGVAFTNTAGPLLELGPVALDGIALHLYGEAAAAGLGGGVQLELRGLAFAPSGGGGTNPVANGIMADAGAQASPASRPAFSPSLALQKHPGEADFRVSLRAGPPPGPWWVLVQRQLGPLYLERVGLDTAEAGGRISRITLLFDGRVEIFGLTAAVDQLSLSWLGGDVLNRSRWSVDLMGLAISADMSGIVLAGGLLKTEFEGNPAYVGMLLGRFGIYGLSVFGGYTSLDGDPSFFIFGAVNGPIGGPPAFFVTGLGGGLGINRRLVIPDDPAGFPTFPFIQALDPYASVGDPMDKLRDLNTYFGPEPGTFWFAAGISFTCFSLVDGIAVLAVSFGNGGLDVNLLGLARMALPNPAAALVSIELGLLARFSTSEGLFMVRAALTDNSWLLYEDVRLTGGFALCVWWKGPLAGQFVLTIGGYHPDFHREGYPDVPRLGLAWQVTDEISIKGESFFALTSEALMAGVSVTAVADFGWAWAKVTFGAQGLVYFDPFWFTAEAWATISAGIEIETWFGDISFSITTGASVHVQGPEFSGSARVKVGPCSVTVPFGSQQERRGRVLDWAAFVAKYLEDAGAGRARALSGITGRGTLPAATGGSRNAPTPDGSATRPYEVFAEFEITFTTTVPTSSFDIGAPAALPAPVARSDGAAASLGLKPMNAGGLVSVLRVRLRRLNRATGVWEDRGGDLAELAEDATTATGAFPMGVWTSPEHAISTPPALPTGDIVNAGNSVRFEARARMLNPGPKIDYYTVEAGRRPLPLQATGPSRPGLIALAEEVELPTPSNAAQALAFASERLFAVQPEHVEGGPQLRGTRSRVAEAGYRGDVAAPPLFGNLTDGLAVRNGDPADIDDQDPPEPKQPPAPRTPRTIGYLSGGSRVAARLGGTTVADTRTKRRTAPTLGSVHVRLGRRLPIQLDVSPVPGGRIGKTFAPAATPFTAAPGSARSYALGQGPAASRVAGLSGLGGAAPKGVAAKADEAAPAMLSGDFVALHLPDHVVDVGAERPSVELNGNARVTMLRGDGLVLMDEVVTGAAIVPPLCELVVVQADGRVEVDDGLAGWHTRSRVVAVGSGAGVGAGCVLDVEASAAELGATWTTAGDLVRDAAAITTRFSRPVRTVALVIEADDPERVGDMGLELIGASRSRAADGSQTEASLLVNGTQTIAVYAVDPEPEQAVTVRVVAGGGWRITGVLGSAGPVTEVLGALSRYGVPASTARLLAVQGPGCRPAWQPPATAPKRTAKKAAARRTPAKKTPAKKTNSRGGGRGPR